MTQQIFEESPSRQSAYLRFLDLLPRQPILPDHQNDLNQIFGKSVLVTGAAGSIASELVMQLGASCPGLLVLIDQCETSLFETEMAVANQFPQIVVESYIADITDKTRMERIISHIRPEIIFHAAAYKHVSVMEKHPYEALKANFFGTKILADLAIKYSVCCFLLISTDKAVRPASVMGATKRLAELYVQNICFAAPKKTRFVTTRFGNVLGSSGSFTNILQNQIEKGGPVTITHPFATRYFMTSTEACRLVLHAFAAGKNGDILFFDMGDRIPILSIAELMISAYGLVPHQDIEMIFTGLRPGEKLHEDLLNDNETVKPGSYCKTRIAVCDPIPPHTFQEAIMLLEEIMYYGKDSEIVAALKTVLPYLSGLTGKPNFVTSQDS
ncbi:polysaccharide biosynthesis protein [Dyadobacter aurulentus]|uniref:polysaccharide biosynthesis protein n=1 Tax=Dyadobacter sp. UC 10 TaxID=2605428 RepID=UPI0011F3A524|nr:polysaccharide biosynthesis protein [Dyadobacter sp. UC 10]KAA0990550.1 polysaccharide biosynthesis protein [Dyadobacter sp. UC 10]